MASISQIPIPRAGVDVFGEGMNRMFADLMKRQQMAQERGLQRERLGQQNQQFNQQLGQSEEHFKQEMALRQQQAARAAQNAAIQRQVANLNLKKLERETDPAKQMAYMKELLHGIRSMHGTPGGAQQGGGQMAQGQPMQPFTGMGMPSYDEMQNPTQDITPPSPEQVQQGFGALSPDERYAFEMATGHKLPMTTETPEQKRAGELDLFRKKEEIKKGEKAGTVPLTQAMETKLQGVVTGVDNSLPVLQELITNFKNLPTGAETFNPAAYAAYNAQANAIIEPLINAFGLNVTDATKEMMHDQVFRKTNESLPKYRNRLVDLAKEIIRRRNDSFKSLESGKINPKSQFTNEFFEGLKEETKTIDGKKYKKINGEWHEV